MAKAKSSKAAQAAQGTNVVSVAQLEDLKRRLSQALAVAILAASDNASDEETHRDAAGAVVEILMRAISSVGEWESRLRSAAGHGAKR